MMYIQYSFKIQFNFHRKSEMLYSYEFLTLIVCFGHTSLTKNDNVQGVRLIIEFHAVL